MSPYRLLTTALLLASCAAGADTEITPQQADVQRLQELLRAHYGSSSAVAPSDDSGSDSSSNSTTNANSTPAGVQPASPETSKPRISADSAAYNPDAVLLRGDEAMAALAHITRRLNDPRIPDSHRDTAPICSIETRLFDTLVDSKRRSLAPAGKYHYAATAKLQPGSTRLAVKSQQWQIELPDEADTQPYLITLHRPPGGTSTLHVIAVAELSQLAPEELPDWLPASIRDINGS